MVKYSSFLLTASIWAFTVLCVSATYTSAAQGPTTETDADFFNGNMAVLLKELANIDTSSNVLIKFFRDMGENYINSFDNDTKRIQSAVTEGTAMEKKIQNILLTLKNSTIPFSTEIQSEVKEIEENAATELKKLKKMENTKDIDEIKKRSREDYKEIKKQFKEISDMFIKLNATTAAPTNNGQQNTKLPEEMKTKLIEFLKKSVSAMLSANRDTDMIFNKNKIIKNALSKIRNDLIKLEQMEYHLLLSQKHFKADAAPLTRSPLAHFVCALLVGMLF